MVGVVFNALLLEAFHFLGAKAGGYLISMWCVLGLAFKKQKNGKFKFSLSSFDGLTGETKVVPKDLKKSSLSAFIAFPLLAYLLEVIAGVILMAWANRDYTVNSSTSLGWLYIGSVIVMGPEEATRCANIIKPKHLIPVHMKPGMLWDYHQCMAVRVYSLLAMIGKPSIALQVAT